MAHWLRSGGSYFRGSLVSCGGSLVSCGGSLVSCGGSLVSCGGLFLLVKYIILLRVVRCSGESNCGYVDCGFSKRQIGVHARRTAVQCTAYSAHCTRFIQ